MALVYSYLRFSSPKQEHGDSRRRQLEASAAWIKRNGHQLAPMTLEDLSVPAFRGQNRHKGALSRFLLAIKDGRVKAGDIFLCENLDRLSREGVADALSLFLDILRSGVKIAVLMPYERLYDKKSINDIAGILEPIIAFSLSNLESEKKSERCGDAWKEKRKRALTGEKFGNKRPSWLDQNGNTFKPNAGAKAIKFIFQRTCDGIGQKRLVGEMNEKFPPIGYGDHWAGSYLNKVLNDRAVIGELQCYTRDENGVRVAAGKPILDYYPRIIDDALWHRVQQSKAQRRTQRGPNSQWVNLFVGLVVNARDKGTMHARPARWTGSSTPRIHRLVSYRHINKERGACGLSFDYDSFETHILHFLSEVKPSDLCPESKRTKHDPTEELRDELSSVEGRLEELRKAMEQPDMKLPTLLSAMTNLETTRKLLIKRIELERGKRAVMDGDPLIQAKSVLELLGKTPNNHGLRLKLRAVISQLVESIYVLPYMRETRKSQAIVQIHFRSGGVRQLTMDRDAAVCIIRKNNRTGATTSRYDSLPEHLDLRVADIDMLDAFLSGYPFLAHGKRLLWPSDTKPKKRGRKQLA